MLDDRLAFLGRQRPGYVEDLLGHFELADVVHERAPVDLTDLIFGEARQLTDAYGQLGDALRVRERVGPTAFQLGDNERRLNFAVAVECFRGVLAHLVLGGWVIRNGNDAAWDEKRTVMTTACCS